MSVQANDTWHLLLIDMKRAAEDPEARFAVVDAWAAHIGQLEAESEQLRAALRAHHAEVDPVDWERRTGVAPTCSICGRALTTQEDPS